jgi:uncharacterized protein YprB with RNaseH-like and TPR domain
MMASGVSLAERLVRWRARAAGASPSMARPDSRGTDPLSLLLGQTGGEVLAPGLLQVDTRIGASAEAPTEAGATAITNRASPLPRSDSFSRDHLDALGLLDLTSADQLCLLDTETTGLAGGTGTIAWMVGIARLDPQGLTITQWMLLGPEGEPAMLDALARALGSCSALATYNGQAFDLPLLATRHGLHRRPDPLAGLPHVDLRLTVRRLPRGSAPGLRLIDLERHWLGMHRDDDLPGSAAPAAWRDWLQHRDGRALPGVLRHNATDLEGLARLALHAARLRAGLFDDRSAIVRRREHAPVTAHAVDPRYRQGAPRWR